MVRKIKRKKKGKGPVKKAPPQKPPLPIGQLVLVSADCGCSIIYRGRFACWVFGCAAEARLFDHNMKAGTELQMTVLNSVIGNLGVEQGGAEIVKAHDGHQAKIEAHREHLSKAYAQIVDKAPYKVFGVNVYYPHSGLTRRPVYDEMAKVPKKETP